MSWACGRLNGWVPAAAIRRPFARAASPAAARTSRSAPSAPRRGAARPTPRAERLLRRRADTGRKLDYRGEQLHLQLPRQPLALVDERLHARRQRERLRVEDQPHPPPPPPPPR